MTKGLQSRIPGALGKPESGRRGGVRRGWQELGRAPYYSRVVLIWYCQIKPDSPMMVHDSR